MKLCKAIYGFWVIASVMFQSLGLMAADQNHFNNLTPDQRELIDCLAENFYSDQFNKATRRCLDFCTAMRNETEDNSPLLKINLENLDVNYSYDNFVDHWLDNEHLKEYIKINGVKHWSEQKQSGISRGVVVAPQICCDFMVLIGTMILGPILSGIGSTPERITHERYSDGMCFAGFSVLTAASLYGIGRAGFLLHGYNQRIHRLAWLSDEQLKLLEVIQAKAKEIAEENKTVISNEFKDILSSGELAK